MTSAARQVWTISPCRGLVIAEVMPAVIAIDRNVPLIPFRFGSPKLMFEAPHVELTLSSSLATV